MVGLAGKAVRGLNAVQGAAAAVNSAESFAQGDLIGGLTNLIAARMSFNTAFKKCFVAGTPMKLANGSSKPIEAIRGFDEFGDDCDVVWAKDEHDPDAPLVARRVLQTFIRVSPILNVHVFGRIIGTTLEHPFYVQKKGWLNAFELQLGDRFLSSDGRWILCEGISDTGEVATVYNFEVEDAHTYFVGGEDWGFDVWVHNADAYIPIGQDVNGRWRDAKGRFAAKPVISRQKQDGHILGTKAQINRSKSGAQTSTFADKTTADTLTTMAWAKGSKLPGRPNVKELAFGRDIGKSPSGKNQRSVRVHQDDQGRIHGHPSGPEF